MAENFSDETIPEMIKTEQPSVQTEAQKTEETEPKSLDVKDFLYGIPEYDQEKNPGSSMGYVGVLEQRLNNILKDNPEASQEDLNILGEQARVKTASEAERQIQSEKTFREDQMKADQVRKNLKDLM